MLSYMPRPDCLKHQDHLVSQYTSNEYENMKKINSEGHSKNIAAKLSFSIKWKSFLHSHHENTYLMFR